jgi:O-antigen/teichoic acid export membrane protein
MMKLKSLFEKGVTALKKVYAKGAFHIIAGSFLTKFSALLASIFIVRVLTKDDYGAVSYIENIYGYLYILIGMGLDISLMRYMLKSGTREKQLGYYKFVLLIGSLINLGLLVIIGTGVWFYQPPQAFETLKGLVLIYLIATPLQFVVEANLYVYRAMKANKAYAILSFTVSTLTIVTKFFGAWIWRVEGVVYAKLAVYLLMTVILGLRTYRLYFNGIPETRLSRAEKKDLLGYAVQYVIGNGLWQLLTLNDLFLIGILVNDSVALAEYRAAYMLPANLTLISHSIGIFIAPYFIAHEHDGAWVWKHYKLTLAVTAGLVLPAAGLFMLFPTLISGILYGQQYVNIASLMRLVAITASINTIFRYTTAVLFSSMGLVKVNLPVAVGGVILQVILGIWLIGRYGTAGAAYAGMITYAVMSIPLVLYFRYRFKPKTTTA